MKRSKKKWRGSFQLSPWFGKSWASRQTRRNELRNFLVTFRLILDLFQQREKLSQPIARGMGLMRNFTDSRWRLRDITFPIGYKIRSSKLKSFLQFLVQMGRARRGESRCCLLQFRVREDPVKIIHGTFWFLSASRVVRSSNFRFDDRSSNSRTVSRFNNLIFLITLLLFERSKEIKCRQ